MTIEKMSVVVEQPGLRCDVCNSPDIIETAEGYVCRKCAVVLNVQKLQYDRPYNSDVVQYARRSGSTQIGNKRERLTAPNSRALKRMSQYNKVTDNEKIVGVNARREISRILSVLGLEEYETVKEQALINFKEVRTCLSPGSKYRNVERLVATILYFRFKLDNISVPLSAILDNTELTKKEFNSFYMQVHAYLPNYIVRDRQKYISQKLLEIANFFDLDMSFYFLAKKVLYRLWDSVKNTTDNVIAGLCTGIIALCNYKEELKINAICEFLNIKMSTIQFQVKKRLFEQHHVEGFTTLVGSYELLKNFMMKIGVLDYEVDIISEQEQENGIIEVQLGNAHQVFNRFHDHYLFDILALNTKTHNDIRIIGYLKVYNPYDKKVLRRGIYGKWFKFMLGTYEYFPAKGPPGVG